MKIAIIGGGWFGCHIANSLLGHHDIVLYERSSSLFSGASGNNQNRLHLGYHYPRSAKTREEIRLTHDKFIETYPTKGVVNNLFAIANTSWIDLYSYQSIMKCDCIPLKYDFAHKYGIKNVEGGWVLKTEERIIDTEAVKEYFQEKLSDVVQVNTRLEDGNRWDAIIDCSGGELSVNDEVYFEPAVLAEYDGPSYEGDSPHFALTVMDGLFPCLYPTALSGRWRVSHVHHTARGAFARASEARVKLAEINPIEITNSMTKAMEEFYPNFPFVFRPRYEVVKAVRMKLKNNNASREIRFVKEGRTLRVFSGKICSVFLAEQEVKRWLGTL